MIVSASTKNNRSPCAARPPELRAGGNLPVIDWQHRRIVVAGDRRRGVSGGIVHHNDFIRLAHNVSGVIDRLQRPANPRLFIVSWNDE